MEKEDGKKLIVGDTENFQVLEFSRENRRVLASHSLTFSEGRDSKIDDENNKTEKEVKKIQKSQKKSKLGDLEELSELKKNLDKS